MYMYIGVVADMLYSALEGRCSRHLLISAHICKILLNNNLWDHSVAISRDIALFWPARHIHVLMGSHDSLVQLLNLLFYAEVQTI